MSRLTLGSRAAVEPPVSPRDVARAGRPAGPAHVARTTATASAAHAPRIARVAANYEAAWNRISARSSAKP